MTTSPPSGITPPSPGLEREEPEFWLEDDIPSDDGEPPPSVRRRERARADDSERPSHHKPERE